MGEVEKGESFIDMLPWIELPEDVTVNILQRLGAEEILTIAQKLCSTWWKICSYPTMWRVVHLDNRHGREDDEFNQMCSSPLDRSQGQLIDLTLAYFGEDASSLLNYAAHRSSNLRRLTLLDPCLSGRTALGEAINKLSQLEELHLIMMPFPNANDDETIGISCPMLTSFSFCEHMNDCSHEYEHKRIPTYFANWDGSAIGKTMPNLRLISHRIDNEGLEAILDGCPHLESLDLRQCCGLDLEEEDLGERCAKQIKDLRLPYVI